MYIPLLYKMPNFTTHNQWCPSFTARMSVSHNQALDFVTNKLGVANFEEKFTADKKSALEEVLFAWQDKIPFQTVTNMALDPNDRRMPSVEDNIKAILHLQGGRCWTTNTTLGLVLGALGYNMSLCVGSVCAQGLNNHALVLIKDLVSPGDHHIVDVGLASVSPKAVCLDFEKESEVIENVYAPYKYIKDDGYYVRLHQAKPGKIPGPYTIKDGWAYMYWFKREYVSLDEIKGLIGSDVYSQPKHHLNVDLFCTICPGGRFVFLHNDHLKMEASPGGEVTTTALGTDAEVEAALREHFPSLSEGEVHSAVVNWRALRGQ